MHHSSRWAKDSVAAIFYTNNSMLLVPTSWAHCSIIFSQKSVHKSRCSGKIGWCALIYSDTGLNITVPLNVLVSNLILTYDSFSFTLYLFFLTHLSPLRSGGWLHLYHISNSAPQLQSTVNLALWALFGLTCCKHMELLVNAAHCPARGGWWLNTCQP